MQYPASEDADTILNVRASPDSTTHDELVDLHLKVILRWTDLYSRDIAKADFVDIWRLVCLTQLRAAHERDATRDATTLLLLNISKP